MNIYTATAIVNDAEIGFGEGESDAYAVEECLASLDHIFIGVDAKLVVRDNSGVRYVTSINKYIFETN